MSNKSARQIRKGLNALRQERKDTARDLIAELENAPFKYRFRFAMKLLFTQEEMNNDKILKEHTAKELVEKLYDSSFLTRCKFAIALILRK